MSELVCPIPKNNPSHCNYETKRTAADIINMIRNKRRNPPTHDQQGYALLDTAEETYHRLFKEIGKSKIKKPLKIHVYGIFDHNLDLVAVVGSKAAAMKLLAKDRIKTQFFGRPMPKADSKEWKELRPGAIAVRVPALKRGRWNYQINNKIYKFKPYEENFGPNFRAAVKRCSGCPAEKDPHSQSCHCSLINYIRDQTPKWMLHTDHQLLMKKHKIRAKERRPPQIEIKLSAAEWFDNLFNNK